METWRKAISRERDRRQSEALAWGVGVLLGLASVMPLVAVWRLGLPRWSLVGPLVLSSVFAAVVLGLRAATPAGGLMGWMVCFVLAQSPKVWAPFSGSSRSTAFQALIALFVLTFAATRFGRARKEARGLAEARRGRRASQIAANLGVAALFAAAGHYAGCIAALAEATADTVSSEMGQALGGRTFMVTTFGRVESGTDGGVSLAGTVLGFAAAGLIVVIGAMYLPLWPSQAVMMLAACAGLFFDSLLGATVERRGWIGNDLVNFASTLFAAILAEALIRQ
jgi:uncharacterized protein (TIGR00297 family)